MPSIRPIKVSPIDSLFRIRIGGVKLLEASSRAFGRTRLSVPPLSNHLDLNRIHDPSGDQRGRKPESVIRSSCPPVVGTTKIPPPPRSERNAMRLAVRRPVRLPIRIGVRRDLDCVAAGHRLLPDIEVTRLVRRVGNGSAVRGKRGLGLKARLERQPRGLRYRRAWIDPRPERLNREDCEQQRTTNGDHDDRRFASTSRHPLTGFNATGSRVTGS